MSDPKTESAEPAENAAAKPASTPKPPQGLLHHASDNATRPGFRSPPNNKSKAQKASKKRK